MPRTELPPMPRLDPENGVVMARRVTHIDPGPSRVVSTAPSTEGTLAERLASYRRWASGRTDYVIRREGVLLGIIDELIARVDQLESTQQV
jgi:hypothetical protein